MSLFNRPAWGSVLAAAVLLSCTPNGVPTGVKRSPRPTTPTASPPGVSPAPSQAPSIGPASPSPGPLLSSPSPSPSTGLSIALTGTLVGRILIPATLVSNNGGGILTEQGAAILSDQGAGIISEQGAGVIGNNGGSYRVLAANANQMSVGNATVRVLDAAGQPVKGADGQPLVTATDAQGRYGFNAALPDQNLVVEVRLGNDLGAIRAIVPKSGAGTKTVNADLISTLTTGYILDRYVQGQPNPVAVLDRLPAQVEVETRQKTAKAFLEGGEVPATFRTEPVVAAVEVLRDKNTAVDAQLDYVKSLLLAGLSNQGIGRPATSIATDAQEIAVSPDGLVHFVGSTTLRVWKKDAAGKLTAVAGSGKDAPYDVSPAPGSPAPGDNGPAIEASFKPGDMAFDSAGRLYIADVTFKRIRRVDAAGVITTFAAHTEWDSLRSIAFDTEGRLLVANNGTIDRVGPDGTVTRLAGTYVAPGTAAGNPATFGTGAPLTSARFSRIDALAVSASGAIYVKDYAIYKIQGTQIADVPMGGGRGFDSLNLAVGPDEALYTSNLRDKKVFRLKDNVLTPFAGSGADGHSGDGGSATAAAVTHPVGIAVSSDGTVLIADNGLIRGVKDGIISAVVGRHDDQLGAQPASEVQLRQMSGLAYDPATHSLLVSEMEHLRRLDLAAGTIEVLASKGPHNQAFFQGQRGVDADLVALGRPILGAGGAIHFVASDYQYVPWVLTLKDGLLTGIGGGKLTQGGNLVDVPALGANFQAAEHLELIGDTFYDCVPSVGWVRKFTVGGQLTRFAGFSTLTADGGPALTFKFGALSCMGKSPDGDLYVATEAGVVHRIAMSTATVHHVAGTTFGFAGDSGPAKSARLTNVKAIAFDAAGNLYLADHKNNRVRRIDKATGTIRTIAGEGSDNWNGKTVDTGLSSPAGLAFDRFGNLYIADKNFQQIKQVPAHKL